MIRGSFEGGPNRYASSPQTSTSPPAHRVTRIRQNPRVAPVASCTRIADRSEQGQRDRALMGITRGRIQHPTAPRILAGYQHTTPKDSDCAAPHNPGPRGRSRECESPIPHAGAEREGPGSSHWRLPRHRRAGSVLHRHSDPPCRSSCSVPPPRPHIPSPARRSRRAPPARDCRSWLKR
jgi:hypothetical protein